MAYKKPIVLILFILSNIVAIAVFGRNWNIRFSPTFEDKRRGDIVSLARIARGLSDYANDWGYLPYLEDDRALQSVLDPYYGSKTFICHGAVARYKAEPDDMNMRFRFNTALGGKALSDLKPGDIVVFEPYWPDPPERVYIVTRYYDYNSLDIAVAKGGDIKMTFIPRLEDGFYYYRSP